MDLYAMFEIRENATVKEIKKAYRKKALKYHPDKNPDNPEAANLFHQLSEALKILSDLGARAAYDHVRLARKAAAARTDKLDHKRKKVKLDLEAREKAAEREQRETVKVTRTLEQEIQRLREEGSRILQEEQLAMQKLLRQEKEQEKAKSALEPARLKLRWKIEDTSPELYSQQILTDIFSKHGEVTAVIVSSKKKKGSAIIEFKSGMVAKLAHDCEIGFAENPLKISWLSGKPLYEDVVKIPMEASSELRPSSNVNESHSPDKMDDEDFEAQVLRRMRQMQEQKRKVQN